MTFEDFKTDDKTMFALIRALENVGEATKRIPKTIRNQYQDIPWKDMAGMRDVLIHDYFGVDLEQVWLTAKSDIPSLQTEIEVVLKLLES